MADLANKGFKWSQATVYEVEKGKRPLKLSEASALSEIFGITLQALVEFPDDLLDVNEAFADYELFRESARRIADELAVFDDLKQKIKQHGRHLKTLSSEPGDALEEMGARYTAIGEREINDVLRSTVKLNELEEKSLSEAREQLIGKYFSGGAQ